VRVPLLYTIWLLIGCLLTSTAVHAAASSGSNQPVFIEADQMHYNQQNQMVSAVGNVEIVQDQRILLAERVMYHQPSGTVYALGNVSILETDGKVYFAEKIQLKDDLKQGVIEQFKVRLEDSSLMVASKARQVDEQHTIFEDAVYSPCSVCDEEGKEETPTWQLKAREIEHDKENQTIRYKHARMELLGLPVAYAPYFSHAAPGAKRKSGFLMPAYGVSTLLGTTVEVPYYYNISSNMDATITPVYTSAEGPVLKGEFRHLTPKGRYEFEGSITNPDKRDPTTGDVIPGKEIRGHVMGEGQFHLNDMWNWGFDIARATDDTYLRRYEISNQDILTSRLFLEGFGKNYYDRTYALAEAISFQGLRLEDDPDNTPLILPMMQFDHSMPLSFMDSRLEFSNNLLSFTRDEASDTHRLSSSVAWVLPYQHPSGHLLTMKTSLRGDFYAVQNTGLGGDADELVARVIPELTLDWRYPLVRYGQNMKVMIEPRVQMVVSPNGNNPDEIPNNDSQSVNFADDNLFNTNRYTGFDRVESGPRVNYGINSQIQVASNASINLLFGQSYHLNDDSFRAFGLEDGSGFSDYVGRAEWESDYLFLSYRTRLDHESFKFKRHELLSTVTVAPLHFNLNYMSLLNDPNLDEREEAIASLRLDVTDHWSLTARGHRAFQDEGRWVSNGGGIMYRDECLTFLTSANRIYYRDRDIEPATSYLFQIFFKNLN